MDVRVHAALPPLHQVAPLEWDLATHMRQVDAVVAHTLRSNAAGSQVADLADHVGLRSENADLVAAAQRQAVPEERQRITRDLHDSVTQALYAITLHAEATTRLLHGGDTATAVQYVHKLQNTAQEALDEMRFLLFELRPPILDQQRLVAALQARLDAVEERTNLATQLIVEGVECLPPPVEQPLYRIAQEALNNVLKHAHAQNIVVALRQETSAVSLTIIDDGIGFGADAPNGWAGAMWDWGACGPARRPVDLAKHTRRRNAGACEHTANEL